MSSSAYKANDRIIKNIKRNLKISISPEKFLFLSVKFMKR